MTEHRGLLAMLTIVVSGAILLTCGFFAVLFFEHTQVSVPLILIVVVCAAIIVGTINAISRGAR